MVFRNTIKVLYGIDDISDGILKNYKIDTNKQEKRDSINI